MPDCERQLESCGHPHEIGQRIGFHLPHHLTALGFHGNLARAELAADLLVQQAGHHETHHLALTRRERLVAAAERLQFHVVVPRGFASLGSPAASPLKISSSATGLVRKSTAPAIHRLHRHPNVDAAGDEDDGHVFVAAGHLPLQVQAASNGPVDIEHQAARPLSSLPIQKRLRRAERLGLPAGAAYQPLQGYTYRCVVTDDEDGRLALLHRARPALDDCGVE